MKRQVNLLSGDIKSSLIKMSIPLMGISFVQITYNLVDMFWLGRFSDEAVAAVGTAGLVNYIGNSLAMVGRVGAATWIAQSYGRGNYKDTKAYIESGIKVNIAISIFYTIFAFLMMETFLGFFTLTENVKNYAVEYLLIQISGMVIVFLNPMFAVTYNSIGNSMTPFKLSLIGLTMNFILDPIFIFVFKMGVTGVALATIGAQLCVLLAYLYITKKSSNFLGDVRIISKPEVKKIIDILFIGWPASVQSTAMALIAVVLNTFISKFGPMPMAVYSLGIQIESICWMTADGFSVAVSSFMGQNLGAQNYERLKKGYKESVKIFITIGLIAMVILTLFGENLIALFIPEDPLAHKEGGKLLRIMGLSEILMALEIGINGALNGVGLTKFPAINGLFGNLLRIPISLFLIPYLGLSGIWIAISITMALKGLSAIIAYGFIRKKTDGFRQLSYRRNLDETT